MKKIFFIAFLFLSFYTKAQLLKKIGEKAKQKTTSKANEKIDNGINKGVDSAFSKTEKVISDVIKGNNENNPVKDTSTQPAPDISTGPSSIKAYSKYDFVPGEKVIGFEDFSTGNIGDFPAGWNTSGAAEIVTIEGKEGRWLWLTKPGFFLPEFTGNYPEDFTFEFDLMHGVPISSASFHFVMAELQNKDDLRAWNTSSNTFKAGFHITPSGQKEGATSTEIRKNFTTLSSNQVYTELMSDKYNPVHISIWRQKERIRIYCNEQKIWDIPKAIAAEAKLNAIFFPLIAADETSKFYIGNLRLAIGAPDTRNKMLTQNKWVTHGILFDVNSASIKPESYGTLKEMANVLKEYPELKVKIVGHTDADGNDAGNLDLSQRRAASVKASLVKEFGIDESRMETGGKGESEPIDKNDTPQGKANNRRVEFIKI